MNKVQTQRGINYSEKNFVFLICFSFIFIFSLSFSLANPFGLYDETKPQINPEESFGTTEINNTYNNNTYINVTATVNSTQFSNDNPITINISWLTSFIQTIINAYNFITGTDVPNYEEDPIYSAENNTIARTGICPEGYVVQNTTTNGVQCVSVSILANTSIYSGDDYTYITGQDTVNVNISKFNELYYNKTETYNQTEVNNLISAIPTPDMSDYALINGSNQPFTGDISAPNISFNQTNSFVNTQIGMCFNGTDYIFGNYTGVAGC